MKKFSVFIASPGDMSTERKRVDELLNEINLITLRCFNVMFEVRKWENVHPEMGRPQEVINTQLKIQECDIFIGIIWSRFGSPTGLIQDGKPIESGTEEEFELAYKQWKVSHSPQIMFYRCTKNMSTKVDSEQIHKVQRFFADFEHDEEHPGLYYEFRNIKELENNIRNALINYAYEKTYQFSEAPFLNSGIKKIYTQLTNYERMTDKRASLEQSETISLLAQSGYSFIANFGNKYKRTIENHLSQGKSFRLVIANPWTYSGLLIALGEKNMEDIGNTYIETIQGIKLFKEPVQIIENSQWYSVKFKDSLNGYKMLCEKYGNRIQLRISKYDIPSSILITDSCCFFEPYFPVHKLERQMDGLLLFEAMISKESSIYKFACTYFDYMWTISEDYDVYLANERCFKKLLSDREVDYEQNICSRSCITNCK